MIQASTNANRVLIVAREPSLTDELARRLRLTGLAVECASDADVGVRVASSLLPAVVVVGDLLDTTPVELTWRIRSTVPSASVPIFVMDLSTAAQDRDATQQALGPASRRLNELVDRIAGMFERQQKHRPIPECIECHGLSLDRRRHRAVVNGQAMRLTPTEFDLLWELASRPGFVLSRSELAKFCRGAEKAAQTRTVDAHVKSIRRKLQDRSSLIETVHGIGYRFQEVEPVFCR